LINESTDHQKSSVKIPSLSKSLVYSCKGNDNVSVLLEAGTPVPVRRSDHPSINADATECEVQFSLQSSNGDLTDIAQVKPKLLRTTVELLIEKLILAET
jgi:hypothetical protein